MTPQVKVECRGYESPIGQKESHDYYFVQFENGDHWDVCYVTLGDIRVRCTLSSLRKALDAISAAGAR